MARIFRHTYTKLLPKGAEVFTRKGKRYARFKDAKGKTTTAPLSQDGMKIIRETTKWYIEYKNADDIIKRVAGFTDRKATEQRAAELEKEAERVRSGYKPKEHNQLNRPLVEHLKEYKDCLLNKGNTAKQAQQVHNRALRIIKGCGFIRWSDIRASKIQSFLADLRSEGKGKRGLSAQTSNWYLQAIKQFCSWMVIEGRVSENPVAHLKRLNVKTDRRHDRRALEPDELRKLLEAVSAGPKRFGMTGYERYLLYRFAAETGLRANEIRTLTVGSFDLDRLIVTVRAGYSKRRREDVQSLRADTATLLREFFKGKLPSMKAFGGTYKRLTDKTANMLKADLADAGIPYVDDSERYADFHCLRHTTGSLLAASGVHPKVAQSIMRHSDINLTMSRYTHILRGQESEAVAELPDLSLSDKQSQKATGTYDSAGKMPDSQAGTTSGTTSENKQARKLLKNNELHTTPNGLRNRRLGVRIPPGVSHKPLLIKHLGLTIFSHLAIRKECVPSACQNLMAYSTQLPSSSGPASPPAQQGRTVGLC
ncbi:tyrosine-type recombinase/integrase [Planctomycetota bacterium]